MNTTAITANDAGCRKIAHMVPANGQPMTLVDRRS